MHFFRKIHVVGVQSFFPQPAEVIDQHKANCKW